MQLNRAEPVTDYWQSKDCHVIRMICDVCMQQHTNMTSTQALNPGS